MKAKRFRPIFSFAFQAIIIGYGLLLFSMNSCINSKGPMQEGGIGANADSLARQAIREVFYMRLSDKKTIPLKLNSRQYILEGYQKNGFLTLWSAEGQLLPVAIQALRLLEQATQYGLLPEEYDVDGLNALLNANADQKGTVNFEALAAFELRLSSSLLLFISHLHNGRIDPYTLKPVTSLRKASIDLFQVLKSALKSPDFAAGILQAQPESKSYKMLQKALVHLLRSRSLLKEMQLPDSKKNTWAFNRTLDVLLAESNAITALQDSLLPLMPQDRAGALKQFQHYHLLPETGLPDAETLAALAIPMCARYQQVVINMERWRWESLYKGEYIFINLPTFSLAIMHNDSLLKKHKIIVGLPEHPSPTLTSKLDFIIVYPTWSIPYSISSKEILPLLKENPSYLDQKNYLLFDSDNKEVDPYSIDWEKVKEENFKYSIRQGSGDDNALGLVKFLFKNNFSVYLHDTPYKSLFEKEERAFSHGCIRVENPLIFAAWLLKHDSSYVGAKKLQEIIDKKNMQTLKLKHPVPIYIKYFTCKATEKNLFFYKDIYNEDDKIAGAFFK